VGAMQRDIGLEMLSTGLLALARNSRARVPVEYATAVDNARKNHVRCRRTCWTPWHRRPLHIILYIIVIIITLSSHSHAREQIGLWEHGDADADDSDDRLLRRGPPRK
jgi:hypothetical protein